MKTRRLGRSGPRVSEVGFGGWPIAGDVAAGQYGFGSYGPSDDAQSRAAIRRALELGVTLFDTADVFGNGHSEALLGEVIEAWAGRDPVTIVTKGGINFYRPGEPPEMDFTPYAIANAVQHSRARLRRERIDIYLLMNPPVDLLLDRPYIRETLASLQKADYIQAVGVSTATAADAERLLENYDAFPLDVVEVPLNLFDQAALRNILPIARKRRVGVIAREPLANGFLSGRLRADSRFESADFRAALPPEYRGALAAAASELGAKLSLPNRTLAQAALRFVLDEAAVGCVIPGARSAMQVEENVAASDLPPLTDDERMAIHRVFFPDE